MIRIVKLSKTDSAPNEQVFEIYKDNKYLGDVWYHSLYGWEAYSLYVSCLDGDITTKSLLTGARLILKTM